MSSAPDLVFRKLDENEKELSEGLAGSAAGVDDPRSEVWGIGRDGIPPESGDAWGLFVRDTLAGVAWLTPVEGGCVEIAALALPRGRWGMGLPVWVAGEAAKAAGRAGARELVVRLSGGGMPLGEMLEDAGFLGPDIESEGYPAGEWRKPCDPSS